MGVPAFFRWLSRKYPSVIIDCVENKNVDDNCKNIYEDATLPNPNGIEFDNLYLDMNGIIHPCTHPEDKPAPKNEDEMMVAIFECIDRIFGIVRPRKLLYMAIDGVAPRAKMNQQRSRRFRAAKETVEKQQEIKRIRDELTLRGCKLPPERKKEEHFDSNCITPGTPFMERLSRCLHFYIHERLNNNPAWKKIKVILSDANVPGEGEHKIMDYIRRQRAQPDHDPNTQHVLCGADADLIMLGLATHEPNFTIIREEFLPNKPRPCDICCQYGHEMDKCEGIGTNQGMIVKPDIMVGTEVRFIFVRLNVLREYLQQTLLMPNLPFKYDFERVVDDWVFMCFFVGNDFLPHLPSLEIREGAVDRLVELYKKCVYKTGGFLTNSGEVNLDRVQLILKDLGMVEDKIFKERQKREEQFKAREKAKRQRMGSCPIDFNKMQNSQFAPVALGRGIIPKPIENPRQEATKFRIMGMQQEQSLPVRSICDTNSLLGSKQTGEDAHGFRPVKRKSRGFNGLEEDEKKDDDYQDNDEVRLWEDGFKERYYESKFDVSSDNHNFRYSVALQYVRGLCWVLKYYYQGCASWKWYFPYHYAPFASDFINISGLSTTFEKDTEPFNPLEQLMGVFPAASSSHVPKPWANLMSNFKSQIIDFYPEDFKIDLNGKKFAWQGVALLPFVDERRLFKALKPLYPLLTNEEKKRNETGDSRLYVGPENTGYKILKLQYTDKIDFELEKSISIQGMRGVVLTTPDNVAINGTLDSPILGLNSVRCNSIICIRFRDPKYPDDYIFSACRLDNAQDPPKILPAVNYQPNFTQRPAIGFSQNVPVASIDISGHRTLNHYIQQGHNSGYGYQNDLQRHNMNIPPSVATDGRRQESSSTQGYQCDRQGAEFSNRGGRSNWTTPDTSMSRNNQFHQGGNYTNRSFNSSNKFQFNNAMDNNISGSNRFNNYPLNRGYRSDNSSYFSSSYQSNYDQNIQRGSNSGGNNYRSDGNAYNNRANFDGISHRNQRRRNDLQSSPPNMLRGYSRPNFD